MRTYLLFASLLLVPLSAAAQESPQPSAAEAMRPCTAVVPGADLAGWKEVRATGFTFCVPANWRASGRARDGVDAPTWRGGGGEVTWGTGVYRGVAVRTRVVTRRVAGGEPLQDPGSQVNRFSEVIGGRMAELHDNRFDGEHFTGATWNSPALFLRGKSRDAGSARIQLQVFRTVRFAQP